MRVVAFYLSDESKARWDRSPVWVTGSEWRPWVRAEVLPEGTTLETSLEVAQRLAEKDETLMNTHAIPY